MDPTFWHQRWHENQIAFHEGEVNALLLKCFHRLALAGGNRIFVPLCGKAVDLAWLAAQGCQVVGIELSRSAVDDFFVQGGTTPEVSTSGKFTRFKSETIEILVGDIFDLTADALGPVDAVYDRAALVALPKPMRIAYSGHLTAVTRTARQLLITFDYDQAQMDGPPFAVSAEEVGDLYGDRYRREGVASREITGPLAQKCSGTENAWLLEPVGRGT